ncbi:MAG TPA: hypothetical protein V6D43_04210 [Candidatus Sericytochromatia bacterium]
MNYCPCVFQAEFRLGFFDQSNVSTLGKQMQITALSSVIDNPSTKLISIVTTF